MARRRGGLGSPVKEHAKRVGSMLARVEAHAKLARTGSCTMRLTSLEAAVSTMGKAWAHAFESGGRTAKGAMTSKTVSTAGALHVYKTDEKVSEAVSAFRSECVRSDADLHGARKRRR